MRKIFNIVVFCLLVSISVVAVDYGKYFGDFEFEFNKDNCPYTAIEYEVSNNTKDSTAILELNEDYYKYFWSDTNVDYFSLGFTENGIQLGLEVQSLWEANSEKILLLEGSEMLVGKVLLDDKKTNDDKYKGYFDIYFIVPTYNTSFSYDNSIVFDFTPVYSGEQEIWWIEKATTAVFSSTNLPPITLDVDLEIFEEYEFLSDELKLTGTQDVYFSGNTVSFEVKVGTNLGNHYNNYGDTLQIMYFNAGCPDEGLHVADAVVSIPREDGHYRYYTIPVYYKIPEPNIEITIGGSFYLTFDPANPQNNYISSVPVSINSTVPSYLVNLSLEIFEKYNFLNGYIELINDPIIPGNSGNNVFDLQLKANFADLWNAQRDTILSHFADGLLTVNENMHIGNVYLTLSGSPTN